MRKALLLVAAALALGCGSAETHPGTGGAGGAGTCSLTPPALADTHLTADGTRLRDALGRTVILRGVNAGGRSKFAPYVPFDFADMGFDAALASYLDRAQGWGLDALRVPFTWAAVEPAQGMDDEAFLQRYDAILDAAWKRGMYTIVDFHQDVYAEVFCGDGFPAWTVPDPKPAPHHDCPSWSSAYFSDSGVIAAFDAFWADGSPVMAAYVSLWDRMAKRYQDKPGVIGFEPINEPGWGSQDIDTFEATTLTTFLGTMAKRLRQEAPATLVFFDATGPDAGTLQTSMGLPAGDGLVFAPHYYQLGAYAGQGLPDKVALDLQRWANKGKMWNVPVLVGEFGTINTDKDPVAYLSAHFDGLDKLGMSGTQWEYSVATEAWNSEDFSLARGDGTETPMAAAIVRAYPRAVAGDDVTFTFDAATRGFTLSYTATEGVTEVAVPARLYPKGYDVTVENACADSATAGRLLVQASGAGAKVTVKATAR